VHLSRFDVIFFAVLVPSIILHEVSHGWVALMFGDDTAKRAGRLTLNPLAHIDPFGTIILPLILVLTHAPAFGYAKPVPVNPRQLRDPRNQSLVVSLAGPAVNIVLALLAASALHSVRGAGTLRDVIFYFGFANVILAAFNLLPIPPLDGSALVERVLPEAWWPHYLRLRQYSFGLLILVVLLLPTVLNGVFEWALRLWGRLL
jgi:Zn-dependent protease